MKPNKIFPKYETLKEYLDYSAETYGDDIALVEIKNNTKISFQEFRDNSIYAAYTLSGLLTENNAKCAIISENNINFMVAYFATILSANVSVLIAGDLDNDTLTYQIDHTDCEVVFISREYIGKLYEIRERLPKVKHVILLDDEEQNKHLKIQKLISEGKESSDKALAWYSGMGPEADRVCQILFTSGTSGYNKAVMLSNKNVCCSVYSALVYFGRFKNTIAVLPFYHAYENACHTLPALFCGCTNYINDNLMHLMKNLKTVPAEMTVVVPMVLDSMVTKMRNVIKKNHVERYFDWGVKIGNKLKLVGIDVREKWFEAILSNFNSNLRTFVVGGAAVSTGTYDMLTSVGFRIVNGYGETECAPLIACNTLERQNRLAVGKVIEDMKVKIGEVDENGNGEILVKGKGVMVGYYKEEDATKNVFDEDGWLKTGDLGHFNKRNELMICGRSKNLIILSNGKNVYPEEIEFLLKKSLRYIEEVIVSTDEKQTGIYAEIYPNKDFSEDKTDDEMYKIIKFDVAKFNKKMPTYKYIKDIRIRREEFKKNINKKIVRYELSKGM